MNGASLIRNSNAGFVLCVVFAFGSGIALGEGVQTVATPPSTHSALDSVELASTATNQNIVFEPRVGFGQSPSVDNPNHRDNTVDLSRLRARGLAIPVQNVNASQLNDTYWQPRSGGAAHEALDIMAARGTPVIAVGDGWVAKLFLSKPGGLTLYQFDQHGEYSYYYAHLEGYAEGLKEGDTVRRGQILGYVGSTGNASPEAPHLHFAVFRLGPARQWWRGTPINPFLIWRSPNP